MTNNKDTVLLMKQINSFLSNANISKRYTKKDQALLDFILQEINNKRICLLFGIPNHKVYVSKIKNKISINLE